MRCSRKKGFHTFNRRYQRLKNDARLGMPARKPLIELANEGIPHRINDSLRFVYRLPQEPQAERERAYRWLKRQIILETASSATPGDANVEDVHRASTSPGAALETSEGAFISWERARELLRREPHFSEKCLAIDLPSLSKDLWTTDLADVRRTEVVASWNRANDHA